MIYLIHLHTKLAHAQHYVGFVESPSGLQARLNLHSKGKGSKFLKAVNEAGIAWQVVRTWQHGDRTMERSIKNYKRTRQFCPCCNPRIKNFENFLVESKT